MDRVIDEIILGLLCLPVAYFSCSSSETVTAALLCVCLVCMHVLASDDGAGRFWRTLPMCGRRRFRLAACAARVLVVVVLVVGALAWKPLAAFFPVAAYLAFSSLAGVARLVCALLPLASLRFGDPLFTSALCFLCVVACLMGWRTGRLVRARRDTRVLRDQLQEGFLALDQRNRVLVERQDLEARRAVLEERARIAREIHDNVGHLLTRAVLQVEALLVVHGARAEAGWRDVASAPGASGDALSAGEGVEKPVSALASGASGDSLSAGLAAVGATLNEALGTVRASVHDLHDDAFDARVQLERVVEGWEGDARLSYEAAAIPPEIAYALVAVVREALSNASRHGGATAVRVRVTEYPGFYQLVVKDNGVSARHSAPAGAPSAFGMGIHSMRERIEKLGGTFTAHAETRRGFTVFASVPKPGRIAGDEREGQREPGAGEAPKPERIAGDERIPMTGWSTCGRPDPNESSATKERLPHEHCG